MPRVAKNAETRRLHLEMLADVRLRLEELRSQTEADSLTEVIRRALSVYHFLVKERKKGQELVSRGPAGEREIVIL